MDKYNQHFKWIFWFLAGSVSFVLLYVVAVTFLTIPKENHRYVDISLPLLMGTVIGGAFGFLIGGSASQLRKGPDAPKGTTTADISATITTNPEPKEASEI